MKKLVLIILLLCLFKTSSVHAQTIPSQDTIEKINERVDELKDKVASKVAQLNLVEKKGIVGVVDHVSGNSITILDNKNQTRIVNTDEITKYDSSDNANFDLSDIKKGTKISVIGLYNKDSEKLLARFINETSIPLFINGLVLKTDEDNFTITLRTSQKKDYLVDVERITKTFSYADGGLQSSGFSKILVGQNVIVTGFENAKEKGRITADRLIFFPDILPDPDIKFEIPPKTSTPSPTP